MAVILDTTPLSPHAGSVAMSQFLDAQAIPMRFAFERPRREMRSIASAWALGPLRTLNYEGSSLTAIRGRREVSATAEPAIAVVSQRRGRTVIRRPGRTDVVEVNDLAVLDLTEQYSTAWADGASSWATVVRAADLGLPEATIRAAARGVAPSPLRTLLVRHLQQMNRAIDDLSSSSPAGAQTIGELTLDLIRAYVAGADQETPLHRDVLAQTLETRVEQYILHNLGNPGLTIEGIARTHGISTRKLHYLWAHRGDSLSEFIIQQRLDLAIEALLSPEGARTPVKVVAVRSGFSDPAHFSRRFKARFGKSPAAYRDAVTESPRTP